MEEPSRIIAIGDVHGCAAALSALLDAVKPTRNDLIIPLGDYIDRGPDSRGVLEMLIDLEERTQLAPLLGNHEEMFFAARSSKTELNAWLRYGGAETLASYGYTGGSLAPEDLAAYVPLKHLEFLRTCRDYYETANHFFVHANYDPDLPLAEQPVELLRWTRVLAVNPRRHCSGKTAIVGHASQVNGQILDLGFLKCIDTYCYGGQWLTALDVLSGTIWQADRTGRLRSSNQA